MFFLSKAPMDLLKQIKDKVTSNPDWSGARGLQSVLTHIEIAERYHHRAKADRDEHLYTDVIYRTNHAFEGILKEAYVVLAEKPADKLTPHEIEEYLLSSKALRGRVMIFSRTTGNTGEIRQRMTTSCSRARELLGNCHRQRICKHSS